VQQFNIPPAPTAVFPVTAHHWADGVIWAVAIGFLVYCLRELRRTRSPLALILFAGGAIAYLNEPIDDVLGLVNHPRPGLNTVLETIGAVPMWGLPTYIVFFGAIPYVFLRAIQKRTFTLRAFWIGLVVTWILDLLIEIPLLQANLYQYYGYGHLPMEIARFPLYWLFINTTGPILCATILFALPDYFTGWRAPFVILLPVVTDAACSVAVGLPVYSAIHAPHASVLVRWCGALASVAIGLFMLDAFARWILARQAALAGEAAVAGNGLLASVQHARRAPLVPR
jgi:hypothetical protein